MKKSTVLIIFIIYLASIVMIGFFGMATKVYDEIKYVSAIEMDVEAENEEMFSFKQIANTSQGNKQYQLIIKFDNALVGVFDRDGVQEERKYIPLTLIPHVTYDTGDVANAEEESIVYRLSNSELQDKEHVSLSSRGELFCFKKDIGFSIYVEPASKSGNEVGVIINVYVLGK